MNVKETMLKDKAFMPDKIVETSKCVSFNDYYNIYIFLPDSNQFNTRACFWHFWTEELYS